MFTSPGTGLGPSPGASCLCVDFSLWLASSGKVYSISSSHSGDWQRAFCPKSFRIKRSHNWVPLDQLGCLPDPWMKYASCPRTGSYHSPVESEIEHMVWVLGESFPLDSGRVITKTRGMKWRPAKIRDVARLFWTLKAWNTSKSRTQETSRQHTHIPIGQSGEGECESLGLCTENHCSRPASPCHLPPSPIIYTKLQKASLLVSGPEWYSGRIIRYAHRVWSLALNLSLVFPQNYSSIDSHASYSTTHSSHTFNRYSSHSNTSPGKSSGHEFGNPCSF